MLSFFFICPSARLSLSRSSLSSSPYYMRASVFCRTFEVLFFPGKKLTFCLSRFFLSLGAQHAAAALISA